jgi:hypothetical protein
MVNPLEKWFRFKSEVFHVLWAWEMLAVDIHRHRMEVYYSDVMFSQRVANWYRTFASGRGNVINGNRGGRRSSATIEYNTRRATELIQTDTRVSLRLMASDLGFFLGTVWLRHSTVRSTPDGCLVRLQTITNRQELCPVSVSRNVTQDRKTAVCVKWSLVMTMDPPIHSIQ